jgi:uncharacterized protein (DUF2252 family)
VAKAVNWFPENIRPRGPAWSGTGLLFARRVLLDRYQRKDLAIKVVGVGSVGTLCAVILMIADLDDPLFLQVKEAGMSVLEPYAGKSVYANHGQRVVAGQRLMQPASDMFLGWTEGRRGGTSTCGNCMI